MFGPDLDYQEAVCQQGGPGQQVSDSLAARDCDSRVYSLRLQVQISRRCCRIRTLLPDMWHVLRPVSFLNRLRMRQAKLPGHQP